MNDMLINRMRQELQDTHTTMHEALNQMATRGQSLQQLSERSQELEEFTHQISRAVPRPSRALGAKRVAISAAFLLAISIIAIYLLILPSTSPHKQ